MRLVGQSAQGLHFEQVADSVSELSVLGRPLFPSFGVPSPRARNFLLVQQFLEHHLLKYSAPRRLRLLIFVGLKGCLEGGDLGVQHRALFAQALFGQSL